MEQPEDGQALRAMQCGRRMFLAALILASKYLQDRNYSARAWSKISGLNTLEINMNEMTFLSAVNWRLHISETVFQRWTDIVLKYTPSTQPPPSPSSFPSSSDKKLNWRTIIPKLTPELNDIDIRMMSPQRSGSRISSNVRPFSLHSSAGESLKPITNPNEQTPTNLYTMPRVLEPSSRQLSSVDRRVPPLLHMGPLPTPQMTPRLTNINTPAVSIDGFTSCRPSMSAAMAQVQNVCMARTTLDRLDAQSQQRCPANFETYPTLTRRSSLARSSSSASSPESMVSDVSSRSSRSSSISSVTSSICAPNQPRLAIQATRRCANLQLSGRKDHIKNIVMTQFAEDLSSLEFTSSPESCSSTTCPVPDFAEFSLRTPHEMPAKPGCSDLYQAAAHGLCQLASNNPRVYPNPLSSANRKRGRDSADLSLQHNVRHLISTNNRNEDDSTILPDSRIADSFLVPTELDVKAMQSQSSTRLCPRRLPLQREMGRKRACCGEESSRSVKDRTPGPGMWNGIL
ncbi:MAG: hypothetical protein M1830_001066 [Pleopsidium flavum]|nr:MAG: hypothetical protein M1830_001066 [Pleopsidium flavum]